MVPSVAARRTPTMHVLYRWWTHPSDFSWTTAYRRTNPHTPAGIGDPSDYAAGYLLAAIAALVGAAWMHTDHGRAKPSRKRSSPTSRSAPPQRC